MLRTGTRSVILGALLIGFSTGVGFALLQDHWGCGYAREAAMATLTHARELGLRRIVAILSRENDRSARVLRSLGFVREGEVVAPPGDKPLLLYSVNVSNA